MSTEYPAKVSVSRQSLLDVVRKLDIGAKMDPDRFAHSFDDLREVFTQEEFSSGVADQPGMKR